jgi:hypothetical protein
LNIVFFFGIGFLVDHHLHRTPAYERKKIPVHHSPQSLVVIKDHSTSLILNVQETMVRFILYNAVLLSMLVSAAAFVSLTHPRTIRQNAFRLEVETRFSIEQICKCSHNNMLLDVFV